MMTRTFEGLGTLTVAGNEGSVRYRITAWRDRLGNTKASGTLRGVNPALARAAYESDELCRLHLKSSDEIDVSVRQWDGSDQLDVEVSGPVPGF